MYILRFEPMVWSRLIYCLEKQRVFLFMIQSGKSVSFSNTIQEKHGSILKCQNQPDNLKKQSVYPSNLKTNKSSGNECTAKRKRTAVEYRFICTPLYIKARSVSYSICRKFVSPTL